eukprot:6199659-Pleurochrysis_carterae.AAC.1
MPWIMRHRLHLTLITYGDRDCDDSYPSSKVVNQNDSSTTPNISSAITFVKKRQLLLRAVFTCYAHDRRTLAPRTDGAPCQARQRGVGAFRG